MFLNFGRFFGFGFQSKMDTLLKQENLTLETILNEEDILSELKNQSSGKFADFIISHPIEYKKMIHYITNDVPTQQSNMNTLIKYSFLISEILGSENEKLINFLFEKQEDLSQEEIQNPLEDQPTESETQKIQHDDKLRQRLLPDLLSLLENDSLLITSAGYFAKIISAIIHKRGYDFWDYLKDNPEILTNLFKHANIRHITEIFEKLIILDTCQEEHDERLSVEERKALIKRLLKYLKGQSYSNTKITNISESLIEVYKRALMSLDVMVILREILLTVEEPEFFLDLAMLSQNSSLYNLLNIQYEFYNKISQLEDKHYDIDFVTLYKPFLNKLTSALNQENLFRASFQTTYGTTIKPLGDSKLSLISIIISLIQKQELAQLIEKGEIFQQVINLVTTYSTNNQLHILFEKLSIAIIDSKNTHLHELLFKDTNFLNFLITNNGYKERRNKHGYQGILTKITTYINSPNILQQHKIIQSAIGSIEKEWLNYIQELKAINEIEQSWLLGVNPRFREQVNVDCYSPPLLWPEPLGSEQYKSINNPSTQTNENSQECEEENSNNNQEEAAHQHTDQFELEEAQIETQTAVDVVQVKEENIELEVEQLHEKHEENIVDSPVYIDRVQFEFEQQNQDIPDQTKKNSEQSALQEQQQEEVQKKQQNEHDENTESIQEQRSLLQQQPLQEEQQNQQQSLLEQQSPKSEEENHSNKEQRQQNEQSVVDA